MPARLTVFFPHQPTRIVPLAEDRPYKIGRDPSCDVVLDDPRISHQHTRLWSEAGIWRWQDLGSKNGTEADGENGAEGRLSEEAWLSLGGLLARFEILSEDDHLSELAIESERRQTSLSLQKQLDPAAGLEPLLRQLLQSVLDLSGAERGLVLLTRGDNELELTSTISVGEDELVDPSFAGSAGALEQALKEGRPVVFSDVRGDADLGSRPSVVAGGIRALICLPLMVMGQTIGVVYADSREPGSHFTELDVEILRALASHASLAIGAARLRDEMNDLQAVLPSVRPSGRERFALPSSLSAHSSVGSRRAISTSGSTWSRRLVIPEDLESR